MPILNMIAQGSGGGGGGSNVGEPTNLSAFATSNSSIDITWTDNNLQAIPPSTFQKSVLVRKVGSAPTTPSDGTTVVTETVMNTYQSSAYTDTGLTQGTIYYYQVFSYSTDGGITYGTPVSATPQGGWHPGVNTIAYWKLNGDLTDEMGSYNGTATGGATITYESLPGDSNVQCVKVSSSSFNDGISLSASICNEICQQQTSFTFGGFIKRTGLYTYLLYLGGANFVVINFCCDNQSHFPGGGGLFLELPGQSENQLTGSYADGLWHSILWTYDNTTRIKSFYVDGQLAGTLTASNDYTTSSSGNVAYLARINNDLCMSNMVLETNVVWDSTRVQDYHNTFKSLYGIS